MRALALCCTILALSGCAKPDQPVARDTTVVVAPPVPAPPAPISLASVAGTWDMHTMAAGSDSVLVSYQMIATADTTGWSLHFPKRAPVSVRVVSVSGDSIVSVAGPYASVLRKGVTVTTNSVMRLQDDKLVGTTVAHYSAGADSVRNLRTEGTRAK